MQCKKDSLGLDIGLPDFNIWRSEKYGVEGCTAKNLAGCGADEDSDRSPMDSNFNYIGSGNLPIETVDVIDSIDFNIWLKGYFAHRTQ